MSQVELYYEKLKSLAKPVTFDDLLKQYETYRYTVQSMTKREVTMHIENYPMDWVKIFVRDGFIVVDSRFFGIEKFKWRGSDAIRAVRFLAKEGHGPYLEEKWKAGSGRGGSELYLFDKNRMAHDIVSWWDGLEEEEKEYWEEPPWWSLCDAVTSGYTEQATYGVLYEYNPMLFDDGMDWGLVPNRKGYVHAIHAARCAVAQDRRFL